MLCVIYPKYFSQLRNSPILRVQQPTIDDLCQHNSDACTPVIRISDVPDPCIIRQPGSRSWKPHRWYKVQYLGFSPFSSAISPDVVVGGCHFLIGNIAVDSADDIDDLNHAVEINPGIIVNRDLIVIFNCPDEERAAAVSAGCVQFMYPCPGISA